ncbi:outer membrane protein [Bradyrhizobium sp. AZCC 2289]|uniref:outer membrane protein n=1 Tax=Bradyrhizobium sp. AZCC 2289 TaxID=3117026 RepID=UPI002FF07084
MAFAKSILSLALAVSTIGSASAADQAARPYTKAPPIVSPAYDWSGFYIGVNVGGAWNKGDLRADYLPFPGFGLAPTLTSSQGSGVIGGVHGGYNWAFASKWVLGVEGDYSAADVNSSIRVIPVSTAGVPDPAQPTSFTRNLKWLASARVRAGYTVVPNVLLYVTGGGAWGGFDYNASFVNTLPGSNNWSNPFSATSSGYVVGGGGEWMLTNNWILRAEYLFYHLSGKSNLANNPAFPTFPILFSWNATDTHVARVGVSYKFGGPVVARY